MPTQPFPRPRRRRRRRPRTVTRLAATAASAALVTHAALTTSAPLAAQAPGDWFVGAGVGGGGVPSPFVHPCDTHGRLTLSGLGAGTGGFGVRAGRVKAGGTAVVVDVTAIPNPYRNRRLGCTGMSGMRGSGYEYPAELEGSWTQAIEVALARSPDLPVAEPRMLIPLRAAVALGWVRGTSAPYAVATGGLRFGRWTRFTTDAGLRVASLRRRLIEAERVDDFETVHHLVRRDRVLTAGLELRLGVELPLGAGGRR